MVYSSLASGEAGPDQLHDAKGWCAPPPLAQVMLGNGMLCDHVPAACCAPYKWGVLVVAVDEAV